MRAQLGEQEEYKGVQLEVRIFPVESPAGRR
jgi:hypothetical protein